MLALAHFELSMRYNFSLFSRCGHCRCATRGLPYRLLAGSACSRLARRKEFRRPRKHHRCARLLPASACCAAAFFGPLSVANVDSTRITGEFSLA